jgi:hypothetical protein
MEPSRLTPTAVSPPPAPGAAPADGEDMLLVFADISGYTRFIWENRYTQAHAAGVVGGLLDAVVDALHPVVVLAKLEGDAAFCAGPATETDLGHHLLDAFAAFSDRRSHVIATNGCPCQACMTVDALDLKIIVHCGPVIRHAARTGDELAGVPVILLHRLAKNGVAGHRYILWTEAADAVLADLPAIGIRRRTERDPDLGAVPVRVFTAIPGAAPKRRAGWLRRQGDHLLKAWSWAPLMLRRVPGKAAALVRT